MKLFNKDFLNSKYMNDILYCVTCNRKKQKYLKCPTLQEQFKNFVVHQYNGVFCILTKAYIQRHVEGNKERHDKMYNRIQNSKHTMFVTLNNLCACGR